MKLLRRSIFAMVLLLPSPAVFPQPVDSSGHLPFHYTPASAALFDSIVALDSILFHAYNTCDLGTQAALFSDSIEFYHDQGGLTTSKDTLIARTKRIVCGKVTRELVNGSIEVYPIAGYGAVEMGLHRFFNNMEPDPPSQPSRFIILWQQQQGEWKIRRVISLH